MEPLTEREYLILDAVIRSYVETAEPAGSRSVVRRFNLGLSPATVRNTMSDLEEKGYLYHPHTSAGRVPTDRAYRVFVDSIIGQPRTAPDEARSLRQELESAGERSAVETLIRHAAQVLGLLTQELGIAVAPRLDEAVLDRLELIAIADGKILLILALRAGGVRTIYVDVPGDLPPATLAAVGQVLNNRLAGLTLRDIRATLRSRLRDSAPAGEAVTSELLNVFLQSAEDWFGDLPGTEAVHLGSAAMLAEQPEFNSGERLRHLIELTERRDLLRTVLGDRIGSSGLQITIGGEHGDPVLAGFTVVTSEYRVRNLRGVIGVIGPTRMPYDRIIALVESTSTLVSEFLE
ncbi:heat-inducible transcriptional repressor HrcA [soil metagenome]|nr:heat-inducible transcription repressor HrcA [Gemmatimonadota bacterium]